MLWSTAACPRRTPMRSPFRHCPTALRLTGVVALFIGVVALCGCGKPAQGGQMTPQQERSLANSLEDFERNGGIGDLPTPANETSWDIGSMDLSAGNGTGAVAAGTASGI